MNELTPLPQLVAEIKILSQQTAATIIEIGKRLAEAKGQVEHGEWAGWLQSNFDLSDRTARNFMRAAAEFGDENGKRFPISKIYALLDVPAADREAFIAMNRGIIKYPYPRVTHHQIVVVDREISATFFSPCLQLFQICLRDALFVHDANASISFLFSLAPDS